MSASLTFTFGWTLLHFLWQGTALALGVWIALALARRARPELRYLVAWAGLALMAVAPLTTFVVLRRTEPRVFSTAPNTAWVMDPEAGLGLREGTHRAEIAGLAAPSARPTWRGRLDRVAPNLLPIWGLGVLILALRHAGGLSWLARARRRSRSLEDALWAERLDILRRHFGVARTVALRVLDELEGPVMAGILKPVILVPTSVLTGLPAAQVELLLAHELAHVVRHDALANLLQRILETLLFFHPAVWWLGRRVRQERERCCDALAADVLGDPCGMAEALTSLENMRHISALPAFALGATGGSLKERVQALLDFHTPVNRWRILGAAGLVLVCIGSGWGLWKFRARRLARYQPHAMEEPPARGGQLTIHAYPWGEIRIDVRLNQSTPEAVLAAFAKAEASMKRGSLNETHETIVAPSAQDSAQTYTIQWGGLSRPEFMEYWHRLKARPALECPPDAIVVCRDNLGLPWDNAEDLPLDVWVPKHADRFNPEAARLLREALLELRALAPTAGRLQEVRRKLPETILATLKSPEPGTPILRGWQMSQEEALIQRCQEEPYEPKEGFHYELNRLVVDLKAPGEADVRALKAAEELLSRHNTTGRGASLWQEEVRLKRLGRNANLKRNAKRLTPQEQEEVRRWREEGAKLSKRIEELDNALWQKGMENARSLIQKRLAELGAKDSLPGPAPTRKSPLRLDILNPSREQPNRQPQLVVKSIHSDPALLKQAPAREAELLQQVAAQILSRLGKIQASKGASHTS